jgi:Flp pilus assembly protein TadB
MGMCIHVKGRKNNMANILLIIGIILLVLWLLGLIAAPSLGSIVYVALVIGIILIVVWLVMRFSRHG